MIKKENEGEEVRSTRNLPSCHNSLKGINEGLMMALFGHGTTFATFLLYIMYIDYSSSIFWLSLPPHA